MQPVDLSDAEIVDAHCHPYRIADLLSRDPASFDTRCMFLWTGLGSSGVVDAAMDPLIDELTDTTVFAIALCRWLAQWFGCEPTREAVAAARDASLRADPAGYSHSLLDDAGIVAVLADDGYPQPTIPREEFEEVLRVPVHRVARIEPWIVQLRDTCSDLDDLVSGLETAMTEAAADPRCVAYKSVIAYRTGLDVGNPASHEATAAFERWRADGWRETREHAKPVRDFLLRRALLVARAQDRPFHIHCGVGDPDIDLVHARPQDLWPLLVDMQQQPVVLVHAGFPWVLEAGAIASILPNVYLELSELIPWGWSQVEWALEMLVGTVPAAKLLHGSDEASEPEMFWAAARLSRACLTRVLQKFVERDYLGIDDAHRLGRGVLAGNVRHLHGIVA